MLVGQLGLSVGSSVVMGIGASAIGMIGTSSRLLVRSKDSLSKRIADFFLKTIQNGSAAFALLAIGSILLNPLRVSILIVTGGVLLITPGYHEVVKLIKNEKLKNIIGHVDQAVGLLAQSINTLALTAGFFMTLGLPAGVVVGVGLIALNALVYKKV